MSPPLLRLPRGLRAFPRGVAVRWASESRSVLREEDSRWSSLLRNLGTTPEGQLKALQLVDSQQVLEQKPFQRLLDDVAQQLPRDVGEKTTWESRAELAAVLRKLNVQSLHQRLGTRLNNALLQDSDAKLESLMENFCGEVADDYTLWLLNRKLEGLVGSLKFDELVSFLHLLVPWGTTSSASSAAVVVRQQLVEPKALNSTTWAKLLQIYSQEAAAIQAWEILDALMQGVDISNWKLPEAAVLGSTLERHGLPKHSKLAETLLANVLPQISQESDVELNLLCISGGLSCHRPNAEMAQKIVVALQLLSPAASANDALQVWSLLLRLWRHWPEDLELPKRWSEAHFSPSLVAQLLPLCASAGARFTADPPGAQPPSPPSLAALQPFLSRLDAEANAVAKRLEIKDFCSVAFSLARLGLGSDFLVSGDLEARLASASLSPGGLAHISWAMAFDGASRVAWALLRNQLKQLAGSEVKAEDQALLFEALGSQAIFDPKAFEGQQVWKDWAETWSSMAYMPRSQHLTSVTPLLSHLQDDCEVDVPIGQSPWNAPILFVSKKIILDLVPTARHPASGKTRGDLMLKHHTWAESGHTVLVIPDPEWPMEPEEVVEGDELKESQKHRLRWIKEKVEQLHKSSQLQQHPLDDEVKQVLLTVELGPRGINSDGLAQLAALPKRNQMSAVNKYQATLKDWVKNPTAWLIGIIKEEKKLIAKQQETVEERPDSAAARRPQEGWSRDGRGLDQVRVGESLMGKVTNIFKGRVWVDIGLVKDGSFLYEDHESLKVGQVFRHLKVTRIDLKRNWVELQPQKQRPVPDSPRVPLAKRPSGGWGHKEGMLLADLQVGSPLTGKVTNVLYDRVWVDVGAECDATFVKPSDRMFKVGDSVSGTVSYVDVKNAKKILRMKPAAAAA